ncbi:MAG: HEPN domain-containing protein [Candidatus Geothermincolia bacterium]
MTREPQTRQVNRSAARVFWRRAMECAAMMEEAFSRGQWEAVGVNAVHAAISANDAVLSALRGLKPASADHKDAARVLMSQLKDDDAQKAGKRLGVIVAKKSRVEYEDKRFTEKEARGIVLDTQRFLDWAKRIVPTEFQ